jgi:hypothetical protein
MRDYFDWMGKKTLELFDERKIALANLGEN